MPTLGEIVEVAGIGTVSFPVSKGIIRGKVERGSLNPPSLPKSLPMGWRLPLFPPARRRLGLQ
jgi:hypothetical protein